MLESDPRPLPGLTVSFALFGAMAGFFALLALGPIDDASRYLSPWIAAGCSAAMGAILGAVLRRYRALRNPLVARENVYIRLGALLLMAGSVAGATTAGLSMAASPHCLARRTVTLAGVLGALVGVFLLPACAAVYDSAQRAARAREGSVVSRADRIRVHFELFGTMSFFALAAVPAILCDATSRFLSPGVQIVITALAPVGCLSAILVAGALTHIEELRCEELGRERERCSPSEPRDVPSPRVSDLGLGNEEWSELRLGHAYRGAREGSVVLRGNIDEARQALREIRALGRTSMLIALAVSTVMGALSALAPRLRLRQHDVVLNADHTLPVFSATEPVVWLGPTPHSQVAGNYASHGMQPRRYTWQTKHTAVSFGAPTVAIPKRRSPQDQAEVGFGCIRLRCP